VTDNLDDRGDAVREIIAGILEVGAEEMTASVAINEFESWDSMAQIRIIAELEGVFGCFIPIEKALTLTKIEDFIDAVSP
jgi:acyl carrier protein